MRNNKLLITMIVLILLGAASAFIVFRFYSYVFAKTVEGKVVRVEHISPQTAIVGSQAPPASTLFSYAIAIQTKDGEIHTASSEDRQWAVVEKDQCAVAKFYPYPPWVLDKAGTYYGARLLKLSTCP